MSTKMRYKVNIPWIIGDVLLLAALVFLFVLTNGYYLIGIGGIALVLPVVSAICVRYLATRIKGTLVATLPKVIEGEETYLDLTLDNPLPLPALEARWRILIQNRFLNKESVFIASMPVYIRNQNHLLLPLRMDEIGNFEFCGTEIAIKDYLGVLTCFVPLSCSSTCYVMPKEEVSQTTDISQYLYGVAETEESKSKGNDCAEVSDVREYIPGDKLRDIHWKLSAKAQKLMVKDRVAMAGSEMVLLLNFTETPKEAIALVKNTSKLCMAFLSKRTPVCILCWNERDYRFEEYRCGTKEELDVAITGIFDCSYLERRQENQREYLKNTHPYLYTYLCVTQEGEDTSIAMEENG